MTIWFCALEKNTTITFHHTHVQTLCNPLGRALYLQCIALSILKTSMRTTKLLGRMTAFRNFRTPIPVLSKQKFLGMHFNEGNFFSEKIQQQYFTIHTHVQTLCKPLGRAFVSLMHFPFYPDNQQENIKIAWQNDWVEEFLNTDTCPLKRKILGDVFQKRQSFSENAYRKVLGILALPGYPSCSSGLMRYIKLQTFTNDEV